MSEFHTNDNCQVLGCTACASIADRKRHAVQPKAVYHRIKLEKVYVEYARPFKDADDKPPIAEVWSDGERPKKNKAKSGLVFVYDNLAGHLINPRTWDGEE